MYELHTASGVQVLPAHINFNAPTEAVLQAFITFPSASGGSYTLDITSRSTINIRSHRISSSPSLLRRSECIRVVVEGVFVNQDAEVFRSTLQEHFTNSAGDQVERVIFAAVEEIIVDR